MKPALFEQQIQHRHEELNQHRRRQTAKHRAASPPTKQPPEAVQAAFLFCTTRELWHAQSQFSRTGMANEFQFDVFLSHSAKDKQAGPAPNNMVVRAYVRIVCG